MDSKILKKEISLEQLLSYQEEIVKKKCSECQHYNQNYSCPSFDFELNNFLKDYSKCILYGKKFYTDDELLAYKLSDEMIQQFSFELFNKYKKEVNEGLDKLENMIKDSNAIYVGHCDKCSKCARLENKPCYYPMSAHYSFEALGINVTKLLKEEFNEELKWPIDHKMNEYFILIGGILKK